MCRWRCPHRGRSNPHVRLHLIRVRHDGRVVLEGVADVAILVGIRPIGSTIELVGIVHVVVPLIAIVLPGDLVGVQVVADAGHRRGRNRKGRIGGILVDVGVFAVAEPSRIVVVEQIVVALLAVRIDVDGLQVGNDLADAGLAGVRAIAIGTAAVNRGGGDRAADNRRCSSSRSRLRSTNCWCRELDWGSQFR